MESWILGLALIAVLSAAAVALSRANELFVLRVRGGRLRVARGRLPASLLGELGDVMRAAKVEDAELRAVSDGGRPRLIVRGGVRADQRQQLRNVVGRFTVAQLRTAARPKSGPR